MDTRAAQLLKFRFDHPAQLKQHLHLVDGRTLFFVRAAPNNLVGSARVVLEISFVSSEQVTILRGSVLSRVEGAQQGVWLEFPDGKLARRMADPSVMVPRKQRRVGCDAMVEVRAGMGGVMARMIDVSMSGARLAGALRLASGKELQLRVMGAPADWPSDLGRAEMAREEVGDCGVRFLRADAESRKAVAKLVQVAQQAWARAPELTHPPSCCKGGVVLEPPLPHRSKI